LKGLIDSFVEDTEEVLDEDNDMAGLQALEFANQAQSTDEIVAGVAPQLNV
jgi:hypothetical protein